MVYDKALKDLPQVSSIYTPPPLTSKVYDRNGKLLFVFYNEQNRSWVPLSKIPKTLVNATIAIEDKDFYRHRGFSIPGMAKALWFNLRKEDSENLRGGSTITQQLVKNVFLTGVKTWDRKIKEVVLSVLLERQLTKDEILERYFNQIPYGGDVYGVEAAANKYFDKHVWELSDAQMIFLAGLPAAPSSYSPALNSIDIGLRRQNRVLEEMVKAGLIDDLQKSRLQEEKIAIVNKKISIEAPHFVFYVRSYLQDKLGISNLGSAGLSITTSLDLDLQKKMEGMLLDEMTKISKLRISNGALLVLSPPQGEILSMVGSKNYYATDIDGKFNVTTALRQPGSSIKPINYTAALMRGNTLLTPIDDSPVSYTIPGQKPYVPQNYTGKYLGRVTLKTALASSLNIPSVKLLSEDGIDSMINLGRRMGITSWEDKSRIGLSLALGANEVSMVELGGAYSIFANGGKKIEVSPILYMDNYEGERVYTKMVYPENVLPAEYAFLINSALSDDAARAPIFGLNSKLKISGKTVAVKTGTTNSLRDNWAIGWTPRYLVASWVGNNDNTPMSWVASGVTGATPIWNRAMQTLLADTPDTPWSVPSGVNKKTVCGREEWFVEGTESSVKCYLSPSISPTGKAN